RPGGRGAPRPRPAGGRTGDRPGRHPPHGVRPTGVGRVLDRAPGPRGQRVLPPVSTSEELFVRAERVIPGGVNSPVRAYRTVGGTPRFVASGSGAEIVDADGRRCVDYVQSWGALLFGHARDEILRAAVAAAVRGTSFGAPTELEVLLAERIVAMVPSIESVRLVSSGTEAAMSALRLARGCTGRPAAVKFDGCYHG